MAVELDGREGMQEDVERMVQRILDAASRTPEIAAVPFIRYGDAGVTDLSYRVGFLMFYALYQALGDESFDAALGSYYQEHRTSGGTFEKLLEHLQVHSRMDLSGFFRDWVHTTAWYDLLLNGTPPEAIGFR